MTTARCSNAQLMYRRARMRRRAAAVAAWAYRGLALLGVAFLAAVVLKLLP